MTGLKRVCLLLALTLPMLTFAEDIDKDLLVKYACQVYQTRAGIASHQKAAMPMVSDVKYIEERGETLMAVVDFGEKGFVIMSADDAALPVLAYSDESSFYLDSVAPAALYWIDYLKQQLMDVKRHNLPADAQVAAAWKAVKTGQSATSTVKGENYVKPLVAAKWNQNQYYNRLCPVDAGAAASYDSHVPAGCVAIAMSMIMFYYNYPLIGSGYHSYSSNYDTHEVNFAKQNYRYEMMHDVLTNYNNETAKLIYHAGVSVNMNYGPDGSGSQMLDCRNAMVEYFGFSPDAALSSRNYVTNMTWTYELRKSLNAQRPIIYSGCSKEGCHAFLCDGYDSEGLFHFNWGWGGHGDGYFEANGINTGVGEYGSSQSIIKNLYPKSNIYPSYCSSKTIEAVSGTLEDGSGIYDYQHNQNCTFVIAPPQANKFNFKILSMNTEAGHDSLSFWRGHPSKGQLVRTLSGDQCEGEVVDFFADTAYVTFKTNASVTAPGWRLSYNVTRNTSACYNNKLMLNDVDTISNDSGDGEYASNASCSWLIRPRTNNAKGIRVQFTKMDISPEDFVALYDVASVPAKLLDSYTGTTLPLAKIYELPRVKVVFNSDNYLQTTGFEFVYSVVTDVSVEKAGLMAEEIRLYPNPAENHLRLQFPAEWNGTCNLTLFDMAGRLLKSTTCEVGAETVLDVADIPAGFYMLRIVHDDALFTKKVIIQK